MRLKEQKDLEESAYEVSLYHRSAGLLYNSVVDDDPNQFGSMIANPNMIAMFDHRTNLKDMMFVIVEKALT